VVVLDPQEPVPSGGIGAPKPHPDLVSTVLPAPVEEPTPAPVVGAGPGPTPAATALPEPPRSRALTRDQDGAVLPLNRPPGELVDYITVNDYFYIVTKNAGGDPHLTSADWRLRIDGDVEQAVELDYAALRKLPTVELIKTLECISNFVDQCELAPFGCDLISTARWKGVPLGNVLELAGGLKPGVVALSTVSADEFTTALPIDVALDPDTLLVYEMNGQVLPREHGYPARILVPGRYGMKSAKWVVALRPLRREVIDWYGQRQWSKQGVVRTMTRIDVPARGATLPPGEHRIAGIAYAGDRGISQVEISADDGATWRIAELLDPTAARDAWVRWESRFTLKPGAELTLVSRATDGTGALQDEAFSLPQPDGSSGWHHNTVRATA
jgi:DMSO/TMAO reductase YedYZ molybdopterin-dependent catalytic subunit